MGHKLALSAECLPGAHRALDSTLRPHKTRVDYDYNPRTEAGEEDVQDNPQLHEEFEASLGYTLVMGVSCGTSPSPTTLTCQPSLPSHDGHVGLFPGTGRNSSRNVSGCAFDQFWLQQWHKCAVRARLPSLFCEVGDQP